MRLYECVFIGRQDLSQQQIEALGVGLGLFVKQNGGEVVRSEYCGLRSLAYPIKKNYKGHYYIIQMKANKSVVDELTHTMKFNEDIVRYLLVTVDEFENRENLITQMKTNNDDFNKDVGYRQKVDKSGVDEDKGAESSDSVEVSA